MWKGTSMRAQVIGQYLGRKAGLLLVEVHRDDVEGHRRVFAQEEQDVEQGEGILAAGQADHHLVAGTDHVEIGDRLADLAAQALGELVRLEGGLLRLAGGGGGLAGEGKRGVHKWAVRPPSTLITWPVT
jgi:hypothetical protein